MPSVEEYKEGDGPVIGIDLGTTYSCSSVMKNGSIQIIPNETGGRTTPSVVSFKGEEHLVGEPAKNLATKNAQNTIFDAKRFIGKKLTDPEIQKELVNCPFLVCGHDTDQDKIMFEVKYQGKKQKFSPIQISSMILQKMKKNASVFLGEEVKYAVITVPAYFNDAQRQATIDAGKVAGLKVLRIINEPTAAAVAYGLDKSNKDQTDEVNILVFDIGGGTFDVTLLQIEDDIFEVKATSGDTHLGGEDFDSKMVDFFIEKFEKENTDLEDPTRDNPKAVRKLRRAAEKAKRQLSSQMRTEVSIDCLHEGEDFELQITRAKFESLCGDLFLRCLDPVQSVLKEAELDKSEIDEIVLVGGSTRIPKIQQLLSNFFDGKELNSQIHPDEAVAWGAGIQAHILQGGGADLDKNLVLLDVTPLSLGIENKGFEMATIIKRNQTIPVKRKKTFTTAVDNQTIVEINVYEGERVLTKDNNKLGSFKLTGIKPNQRRGVPQIEVSFDIDESGILEVSAIDKQTGNRNAIVVGRDNPCRASQDEIESMIKQAGKFEQADANKRKNIEARNQLEQTAYGIQNQRLESNEFADMIPKEDKERLKTKCRQLLDWLEDNAVLETTAINEKRDELEKLWKSIVMPLYEKGQNTRSGAAGGMPGMGAMGGMGGGMPGMGGGMPGMGGGMPGMGGGMPGMGGGMPGMGGGMPGMGGGMPGMGGGMPGMGGMSKEELERMMRGAQQQMGGSQPVQDELNAKMQNANLGADEDSSESDSEESDSDGSMPSLEDAPPPLEDAPPLGHDPRDEIAVD